MSIADKDVVLAPLNEPHLWPPTFPPRSWRRRPGFAGAVLTTPGTKLTVLSYAHGSPPKASPRARRIACSEKPACEPLHTSLDFFDCRGMRRCVLCARGLFRKAQEGGPPLAWRRPIARTRPAQRPCEQLRSFLRDGRKGAPCWAGRRRRRRSPQGIELGHSHAIHAPSDPDGRSS
jgi:hypothetical protein